MNVTGWCKYFQEDLMNIWNYYLENKSNPNWVLHIQQKSPADFVRLQAAPGEKWPEKAWNLHHKNSDVAKCSCGKNRTWYRGSYAKRCSPQCSAKATAEQRKKTFAEKTDSFWQEVHSKFKATCSERYGENFASQFASSRGDDAKKNIEQARQAAMIEKYGVLNPIQVPGAAEKRTESMKKWKDPALAKDLRERTYATRVQNGHSVPNDHPSIFKSKKSYSRRIRYLTNKVVKEQNLFPERSMTNHVDHMFSILQGFKDGISPEILAHPANLRILPGSENSKKNSKSSISLEDLLARIDHLK